MKPLFDKVVIIGVGLIGSSLGLNIIRKKLAHEVIGIGRNQKNLRIAMKRKAIHRAIRAQQAASLLASLSQNDLVVLATPVRGIIETLPYLPKAPLVIDVGSTKASIIKEATKRGLRFVGSHPIAGTERSGAEAGDLNLFQKRICLLVPALNVSSNDVKKIIQLWKACGSETFVMRPKDHDRLFSAVSHLPHAAIFTLVAAVARRVPLSSINRFSLGGFKSTTRIALSPPEMWRDIFLENKKEVLLSLKLYQKELKNLEMLISRINPSALLQYLRRIQKLRLKVDPT